MQNKKSKFKIDDIVCMNDEFNFNPAYKVLSIGKIEAIIPSFKDIIYRVSGFSLLPRE